MESSGLHKNSGVLSHEYRSASTPGPQLDSDYVPPESLLEEAQTQAKRPALGATDADGSVKPLLLSGFSE
jgi:hypothetical protein